MEELSRGRFMLAAPIFDAFCNMRAQIYAVLEGSQPGRVWIDDSGEPRIALIAGDDIYLAGEQQSATWNRELIDWVRTECVPQREHILIYVPSTDWQETLERLLAEFHPVRVVRDTFFLDLASYRDLTAVPRALPDGLIIQQLDGCTVPEEPFLAALWGSNDSFLDRSFGYCILDGETFVGSSHAVFIGDGRAEIGVEVREPYRHRGLGTVLCRAIINHCLEHDLAPEWGCIENPPSVALATSLGFAPAPQAPFIYLRGSASRI